MPKPKVSSFVLLFTLAVMVLWPLALALERLERILRENPGLQLIIIQPERLIGFVLVIISALFLSAPSLIQNLVANFRPQFIYFILAIIVTVVSCVLYIYRIWRNRNIRANKDTKFLPQNTVWRSLKIFMCYSPSDQLRAEGLYDILKNDNYLPWLGGKDILPGHDWDLETKKAMKSADVRLKYYS